MEFVNYNQDGSVFESGTNAKSTQGLPIQSFLRLNKIDNERRVKQDAHKTWIRRNKHVIKLRSIMNRDNKHIAGSSPMQRIEEMESPRGVGQGTTKLMDRRGGASSAVRDSGQSGNEFITS